MGRMKDLLITIYNGGDEAVAAVERMGKDWRAQLEQAAKEVEGLRLTNEERKAIERAMNTLNAIEDVSPTATADDAMAAARLRGLLERTRNGSLEAR